MILPERVFEIASKQGFASLAFPAISCGVYRYPVGEAAAIAVRETRAALAEQPALSVVFATFDAAVTSAYEMALASARIPLQRLFRAVIPR